MADVPRRVLEPTISQTIGPFFHLGLGWLFGDQNGGDMDSPGPRVVVCGFVLDGDGAPVPDALVETWQADAHGDYPRAGSPPIGPQPRGLIGHVRVPTSETGAFRIETVKPGRVPLQGTARQAPHLAVHVFMRGLLRPLITRVYFADEPSNENDLVLACVPAPRRPTLMATPRPGATDTFDWNIVLQGAGETVFFDG